jgi:hypothetical protein
MSDEIDEAQALAVLSLLDWDDGAEVEVLSNPRPLLNLEGESDHEEEAPADENEADVEAEWEAALTEIARLKVAEEPHQAENFDEKIAVVSDSGGVSLSLSAAILQQWEEDVKKELEREEGDLA